MESMVLNTEKQETKKEQDKEEHRGNQTQRPCPGGPGHNTSKVNWKVNRKWRNETATAKSRQINRKTGRCCQMF